LQRVERLLAMLLLADQRNAKLIDKVKLLRSAGFANPEIGAMLGTTGDAVSKLFYKGTKRGVAKKTKKPNRK
jgi:hypothetical protein